MQIGDRGLLGGGEGGGGRFHCIRTRFGGRLRTTDGAQLSAWNRPTVSKEPRRMSSEVSVVCRPVFSPSSASEPLQLRVVLFFTFQLFAFIIQIVKLKL